MAERSDKKNSFELRERQELSYFKRLQAWRRMLINEPEKARGAILAAMTQLQSQGVFHYTDLNRFYSQMKNGSAMPGEFGVNTETGLAKRA